MTTDTELRQKFVVTALERNLKKDKAGTKRDKVTRQLVDWTAEMEQQRRSGLSPDDFCKVDKLLSSLKVAEQVVRRTWYCMHAS